MTLFNYTSNFFHFSFFFIGLESNHLMQEMRFEAFLIKCIQKNSSE